MIIRGAPPNYYSRWVLEISSQELKKLAKGGVIETELENGTIFILSVTPSRIKKELRGK